MITRSDSLNAASEAAFHVAPTPHGQSRGFPVRNISATLPIPKPQKRDPPAKNLHRSLVLPP